MAATRGERGRARFVYVTGFGSHRCGGVLPRGARGRRGRAAGDGEQPPDPRKPAEPSEGPACSSSGGLGAAPADLTKETLARKFDFPMPLNEASKVMKKKKKVWDSVSKVISRMLEENEKYRLRLKDQQSSSENSNYRS
ncbi:uncharacterized protein C5orf47 homolog isoform X2 [Erinaceus europaeus]|uniref:Uncharacterized protein C5orf47 homolog isoform X2 n=1 Tax=Erinaceus europaeus TaxID=9365 RepID=A0ABM3XWK0_ERIEU|nr:uncharacterized protein C5orf47 homolog isoform X2 [Erinaceus europaeus]